MCFRDRYSFIKPNGNQLNVKTFFKVKDISQTLKASFKYLLYNPYEMRFNIKNSFESRFFNGFSLANMDEV